VGKTHQLGGPLAKVDLATERGDPIHVEVSHERYQERQLKKDDAVFISPRAMKVLWGSQQ